MPDAFIDAFIDKKDPGGCRGSDLCHRHSHIRSNYGCGCAGAGAAGAGGAIGAGAGRFMVGASDVGPAGGAGGIVRWPTVAGGLAGSLAVRLMSRPPLKAKTSTSTTTATPAIHPQVEFDQGSAPGGRLGSR